MCFYLAATAKNPVKQTNLHLALVHLPRESFLSNFM